MKRQAIFANLLLGAFAGALVILRMLPPDTHDFYPQCPVFRFFHVYCPGCGATRALAALTRLDILGALHYNPLIVLLVPFLMLYFGAAYRNAIRPEAFQWPRVPAAAIQFVCVLALAFAVLRNALHLAL